MKGRLVVVIALAAALVVAAVAYFAYPSSSYGSICTGGPYNAKVGSGGSELGQPAGPMNYTQNGVTYAGYYGSFMDGALSWMKSNTPGNATILSWWDYGNMITGCAGRNAAVRDPSLQAIAFGLANPSPQLAPNVTLADVATALTTTNSSLTLSIMHRYGEHRRYHTRKLTSQGAIEAQESAAILGSQHLSWSNSIEMSLRTE